VVTMISPIGKLTYEDIVKYYAKIVSPFGQAFAPISVVK